MCYLENTDRASIANKMQLTKWAPSISLLRAALCRSRTRLRRGMLKFKAPHQPIKQWEPLKIQMVPSAKPGTTKKLCLLSSCFLREAVKSACFTDKSPSGLPYTSTETNSLQSLNSSTPLFIVKNLEWFLKTFYWTNEPVIINKFIL